MASVWRMVNGWRRLTLVGLAALALAFVPFHPVPSLGSGEPAAGFHVSSVDMHHHGSKRAQHAGPAAMAAAHIPCGMSACAIATLPSLALLGIRAAFHLDLLFPTETGQAQLAGTPEQPPPRA